MLFFAAASSRRAASTVLPDNQFKFMGGDGGNEQYKPFAPPHSYSSSLLWLLFVAGSYTVFNVFFRYMLIFETWLIIGLVQILFLNSCRRQMRI